MASGQPSEEPELTAKECQERIDQFVNITQTNEAQAQMLLQDHDWKLENAINAYFATSTVVAPDGKEFVVSTDPPRSLTLMCWNIDGLDEKNGEKRLAFVVKEIKKLSPDVILLQEVIDVAIEVFERQLVDYLVLEQGGGGAYFTCILIRRTTVYFDDIKSKQFSNSKMGRAMQVVQAHVGKIKLSFINVHLESTKEFSKERKEQLEKCIQEMEGANDDVTVILAGDLNIRDSEVSSLKAGQGLPKNIYDVWERLGSRKELQYTWDCLRNSNLQFAGKFKPRMRFDRVLVKEANDHQVTAKTFNLVGIEKVPGTQSFASDHWAVLTSFDMKSVQN